MWEDPIVAEVRAARKEIAARFNNDFEALCEHYVAKDAENRVKHNKAAKASAVSRKKIKLAAPGTTKAIASQTKPIEK